MSMLLMFRSLTYAQRGERALRRVGFTVSLIKAPSETTAKGCAYALRLRERDISRASAVLRDAGIHFDRLYRLTADGTWEEYAP